MITFLTALTVLLTGIYAFLTYLIVRKNSDMVDEMRRQSHLAFRPYITIHAAPRHTTQLFCLSISNTGKTSAEDLKLSIDKDFYFGDANPENNIKNSHAFTNVITSFSPRAELLFYLESAYTLFGADFDEAKTPHCFNIRAEYRNGPIHYSESTAIDLRPYRRTAVPHDSLSSVLSKVKDELHNIDYTLRHLKL